MELVKLEVILRTSSLKANAPEEQQTRVRRPHVGGGMSASSLDLDQTGIFFFPSQGFHGGRKTLMLDTRENSPLF